MARTPGYDKLGRKKGTWTPEEDRKLATYVNQYGCRNWRQLPKYAGLSRCGKSCRLRWLNYLRPDIRRGNYSIQEEETIIELHKSLGNKWSAIAAQLPGRTDNEIKNHWHTALKKRLQLQGNLDPILKPTTPDPEDLSDLLTNSPEISEQDKTEEPNTDHNPPIINIDPCITEDVPPNLTTLEAASSASPSCSAFSETYGSLAGLANLDGNTATLEMILESPGNFWTEPFQADITPSISPDFGYMPESTGFYAEFLLENYLWRSD